MNVLFDVLFVLFCSWRGEEEARQIFEIVLKGGQNRNKFIQHCSSLLMHRLPKLPSQCYSNGPGNLGSQGSNKEIQPHINCIVLLEKMQLSDIILQYCIPKPERGSRTAAFFL